MKTLLNALLFATMTCSLAVAQRYEAAQLPSADHSSPKEMDVKPEPQKPAGIRAADAETPAEPKADATDQELGVTFSGVRGKHLILKADASEADKNYLCLVLASTEDTMMEIPGLPPLLMTEIVVASGLGVGAVTFDMGPAKLPFTVFTQAVITDGARIAASNVLKVAPVE